MRLARGIQCILAVLFMASVGWAQFNTAQLTGRVQDITGGLVPGATITARHSATGAEFKQRSDPSGEYLLVNLPVGEYIVTVEAQDFKRVNRSGVVMELGKTVRLDFQLEVGPTTEEITVIEETAPLLQTANAEVSDVIENARIVNLLLNGRQFMDLALLSDCGQKSEFLAGIIMALKTDAAIRSTGVNVQSSSGLLTVGGFGER